MVHEEGDFERDTSAVPWETKAVVSVSGQFGAGQFGADNSARQFVPDNSGQSII